jgi:hypothetical protein
LEPGHERNDRARIDPAREERPERHLGNQPNPDRLSKALDELRARVLHTDRPDRAEGNVPVAHRLRQRAALPDGERVTRRQFLDARQHRPGIRNVPVGEVLLDRLRIDRPR